MGHFGSLQSGVEYPLKPHWRLASSQVNCAHSGGCHSMSSVPGLLGACFCCISSSYLSGFCLVLGSCLLSSGLSFLLLVGRSVSLCFLGLYPGVFCSVFSIFGMCIQTSQLGIGMSL